MSDHQDSPGFIRGEDVKTQEKMAQAMRLSLCWVCGQRMGSYRAFVLGPMCAVNRINAEPPNHRECAIYSATHCPFLSNPRRKRREKALPGGVTGECAGISIRRNPGVSGVWVTRRYASFRDGPGYLFRLIGEPTEVLWFAQGHPATRAEVMASIDSGLPLLREMAEQDGPTAVLELTGMYQDALQHLPQGEPAHA